MVFISQLIPEVAKFFACKFLEEGFFEECQTYRNLYGMFNWLWMVSQRSKEHPFWRSRKQTTWSLSISSTTQYVFCFSWLSISCIYRHATECTVSQCYHKKQTRDFPQEFQGWSHLHPLHWPWYRRTQRPGLVCEMSVFLGKCWMNVGGKKLCKMKNTG